jgi:gamma-glutamylcysteine synthetase
MIFAMFFADPEPCAKGPSEDDIQAQRTKWREVVHEGANIKQKVIAEGIGAQKSTKNLEESSLEAMRVAQKAIELMEKSKRQ